MKKSDTISYYLRAFGRLVVLATIVGFVLRIVLMLNDQTTASFLLKDYPRIFVFGFVNDVFVAFIGTVFIFINQLFISPVKYRKPLCYVILTLFVAALAYLLFFDKSVNVKVLYTCCSVLI